MRVLNGGWAGWQHAGGAVETEARPVSTGTFQPRANDDRIATAEWIRQRLEQHENPIVLDARSPEEYSGEVVTAGPRGGHIPGARNLDWREAIAANGRFKPAKELRGLLRERGLDFDREVVTYCNSGTRSSHLYFVLRLLGHPRVRNYDGSGKTGALAANCPQNSSAVPGGRRAVASAGPRAARPARRAESASLSRPQFSVVRQ